MHDELLHYGVKGMKWSVRRSIGKQARQYAYAGRMYKKVSKKIERQESKTNLSKIQKRKLKKKIDYQKKLETAMDKLVKDIKPDDIKQAKVDLAIREASLQVMGGLIGRGIYDRSLKKSIKRYM